MIIPEQFKFLEQQWTIRPAMAREMPDDMGQCKAIELEVVIDDTLPRDIQRQVLWHELIHVIEQTMQLELTERQVDLVAHGLIHLLRQNPELLMTFVNED